MSISTKCTCGRSLNGLCHTRVKECTQFASVNNTQLPAEWLEEIKTCAIQYAQGLKFPTDWAESRIDGAFEDAKIDFHAGATAYAVKLQEAQQEIERLKQWKSEASTLLDPILKYGQSKEANIPLGESIIDKVLERCKGYDQAHKLLQLAQSVVEPMSKKLYNEIKTFLDGTK